ncbi:MULTISPECIES: sulfonate ABC transporter substrate-binding protein [unclassified Aureimonas]|uniref:sulfonate ABC transporter substrate-binding protein n=1 Tax=unclassified Aureimonas TaxID=2615206 RepID=UPI0006FC44C2|nr:MULTISPECIES: sulfonate ABC transporter substrate-binding protein [unclassified Aureimonas]KQT68923.1 ABC transporter substrate-binding protein [Aureimonas sp. Leaf460]KQT69150.1 ABC transporter substrate-binding protein [Aureimonas sp. Leaf427]
MSFRFRLAAATAVFALALSLGAPAKAEPLKEFNVGFQKNGVLVVARQQQLIEKALADEGIKVNWIEFQAGPPLLEALNVGSIDFGTTGDSPPIFAQAAGADLLYVAALPSKGRNSAILVQKDSELKTLADLKGHKLAFTKGSSAHNVAIAALEKVGLSYDDVTPVYLSPADAGAAFSTGAVDAWSIWDPFYAGAELNWGARILATGPEILDKTGSYFLANGTFTKAHPEIVTQAIGALGQAGAWAEANRDKVAEALSEATGVPVAVQERTAERGEFTVTPVTPDLVASQQKVADRFAKLGLIPAPIKVSDVVWTAPAS